MKIAIKNEQVLIFERMDIDIMDVFETAATKWNFNVCNPCVGEYCLPVDPYYLVTEG